MQVHADRAVRQHQIEKYVLEQDEVGATVTEVARALGMKPSTHLKKLLLEMVAAKVLVTDWIQHRPNVSKRIFWHVNARMPVQQEFDQWIDF